MLKIRKKTYEEVKYYIEIESNSGCELISKEYKNNSSPLILKCKCGEFFTVSFNAFKEGNQKQCEKCSKENKHNRIYNQDRINKIIQLYQEGNTMFDIGKIIKIKEETISKILKENNIKTRNMTDYYTSEQLATKKKYVFNENYFEVIDSKEKAYWLGFLFADGNVYIPNYNKGKSKGGTVEISLKEDDDYHLYNFRSDIEGDMPITYRDVKLNDKFYHSCRISIGSIKMCNDLINYKCIPVKSLILKFPENLSENLYSHFIRGYIDGDGCVFFKVYQKCDSFSVSLLGTIEFLTKIKSILEDNNIKCSNVKPEKSKAFNIKIGGRDNLVKLYNYLYNDASRFLGRKIDLFRNALIYYDKDFDISPTAKLFAELDEELQDMKFEKWYKKSDMYKILQNYKTQQINTI